MWGYDSSHRILPTSVGQGRRLGWAMVTDPSTVTAGRTYLVGNSRLTVRSGNITASRAEVIVSSDDDDLSMGGGVSRAIGMAGSWHDIRDQVARALASRQPLVGDVVVTSAPGLTARFVFHAVTISYRRQHGQANLIRDAVVRQLVTRALDLATRLECRSIAFPLLATGVASLDARESAIQMIEGIASHLVTSNTALEVEVYLFQEDFWHRDHAILPVFENVIATRDGYALSPEAGATRLSWWETSAGAPHDEVLLPDDGTLPEGRRQQSVLRTLRWLDERRAELETEHVSLLVGTVPANQARLVHLEDQLARLKRWRERFGREASGRSPESVDSRAVFVSSTYVDLRDHRNAVRQEITDMGLNFIGMEGFLPGPSAPADVMLDHLRRSRYYLGIIGWRYGSRDPDTGKSYTQFEYEHANALGLPVFVFMASEHMPVLPSALDEDDGGMRVRQFRNQLRNDHIVAEFSDTADLKRLVRQVLATYATA